MQLEPVWRDIRQALQSLVDDGGGDFIRALTGIETSLNDCSFHDRFLNHRSRQYQDVEIRDYDASLAAVFSELNRKWIEHYFAMEEADARVLDDPDGQIIAKGGQILFALERTTGEVLGTCALLHVDQQRCELAKMAVDDAAKGRRLGIRLGQAILDAARSQGYETIFLESNRKLTPAISLYKKLGFIEQPFPSETEYSRADIYMELDLAASAAA
jgi:GNAT superfamily N-acetyltransferase